MAYAGQAPQQYISHNTPDLYSGSSDERGEEERGEGEWVVQQHYYFRELLSTLLVLF